MKTRLQTSLIIAVMVALCMSALPGVAEQSVAEAPPALSFALPLADTGASFQVTVATETLHWISDELNARDGIECEQTELQVADTDSAGMFSGGLASEFDMPFFSFAGLLGGAVSQ